MKQTPGKIVIFGQYKSGTTALFSKIHNSLPATTRTLFEPLTYVQDAKDAERWVLAKTILKFPGHPEPVDYETFLAFDRKVYLTRDPRDWLVSATLFLAQEKPSIYSDAAAQAFVMDYLRAKEQNPRGAPLKTLLEFIQQAPPVLSLAYFCQRTQGLHEWCFEFENRLQDYTWVKYEDFIDGRIQNLIDYLEIPLYGDAQVADRYQHVVRSKSYGSWRHWLTAEDIDFFQPFFQPYIERYNYPANWDLSENPKIDPQHSSEYVARVIDMKRKKMNS